MEVVQISCEPVYVHYAALAFTPTTTKQSTNKKPPPTWTKLTSYDAEIEKYAHENLSKVRSYVIRLATTTSSKEFMLPSMQLDDPQHNNSTAKMIFGIKQMLPTTMSENTSIVDPPKKREEPEHLTNSHLDVGIYVSQFTPKDTYSEVVPSIALISPSNDEQLDSSKCTISTKGLIKLSAKAIRKIRLSEDIYSYNTLIEQYNGHVRVHIVRDINPNEELVAWIELELTLLMGIPFLTPLNIQGNNCYTCHMCCLTFETPHPLKIHIALDCGRSSMDTLWKRLHDALGANIASVSKPSMTTENFSTRKDISSTFLVTSTSISPTQTGANSVTNSQFSRLSAFKPIASSTVSFMPTLSSYLPNLPAISALPPRVSNSINPAAQIEAIVSNMGASKQGHLCIYCGKVYSRKYGLKIHIRTHTGFKPLKCKFCLRPFGDPSNLNKHVRLHLQSHASSSNIDRGGKEF